MQTFLNIALHLVNFSSKLFNGCYLVKVLGPRQIGPLAIFSGILGPGILSLGKLSPGILVPGKLGPGKLGPWKMLVQQTLNLKVRNIILIVSSQLLDRMRFSNQIE